jgi:primosomal protein N'
MYVLDVIPLSAGAPAGSLSYRSKERLLPGTIVDISLRSTQIRGIVTACISVREAKSALKTASFMLKSGAPSLAGSLPETVVVAAQDVATYHAAPLGPTLSALLGNALSLPTLPKKIAIGDNFSYTPVELSYGERIKKYRKIIDAAQEKKQSVLIVAPTTVELARLASEFAEYSPIVLSGGDKIEKREAAQSTALVSRGLILATPSFIWTPYAHLGAIILERISAGSYLTQKRPYLDLRLSARALAQARMIQFIVGDYPLPLEWRKEAKGKLLESNLGSVSILNTKRERLEGEFFKAVPDEIMHELKKVSAAGGRAAVLAVRKGYSPAVVCRDCGSSVKDELGQTLSFATTRGARIFRSANGKTQKAAATTCDVCGSWNLLPLGIGVERVIEEIEKAIPDVKIVRLDTDTVRTPVQARKASLAANEKGIIIVGTEFMLPFLDPKEKLDYAAIASADSLLAMPFWRIRERLVHIGITLRERSLKSTIATRRADDTAFSLIENPATSDFFNEETSLRETFSYPPFGHLVVVHAEGSAMRKEQMAKSISDAFGAQPFVRLPDRAQASKVRLSFVAKYKDNTWPNPATSDALAQLPPWIKVTIDSESLW